MNDEQRRPGFKGRTGPDHPELSDSNIRELIAEIEIKLKDAITPESINGLNSFERKLIHRHFDHNKDFETRTYRNGDKFTICVYPVGNIENFARAKAKESMDTGDPVALPPMGSYERYIIHNSLQDISGVQTASHGEGRERHVRIVSKQFGRGLKRIVKKIKLF